MITLSGVHCKRKRQMLRAVNVATFNSLGYSGLELGFAFGIQAVDSESFYNFVSSSDHRPTWRNRAK